MQNRKAARALNATPPHDAIIVALHVGPLKEGQHVVGCCIGRYDGLVVSPLHERSCSVDAGSDGIPMTRLASIAQESLCDFLGETEIERHECVGSEVSGSPGGVRFYYQPR